MKTSWKPIGRTGRVIVAGVVGVVPAGGGGTAWALDRYVVDHVHVSDVSAYEAAQAGHVQERRLAIHAGRRSGSSRTVATGPLREQALSIHGCRTVKSDFSTCYRSILRPSLQKWGC
jgi:hypothetical protein